MSDSVNRNREERPMTNNKALAIAAALAAMVVGAARPVHAAAPEPLVITHPTACTVSVYGDGVPAGGYVAYRYAGVETDTFFDYAGPGRAALRYEGTSVPMLGQSLYIPGVYRVTLHRDDGSLVADTRVSFTLPASC